MTRIYQTSDEFQPQAYEDARVANRLVQGMVADDAEADAAGDNVSKRVAEARERGALETLAELLPIIENQWLQLGRAYVGEGEDLNVEPITAE